MLLDLTKDATHDEVKKAYRKVCVQRVVVVVVVVVVVERVITNIYSNDL